MAFQVGGGAVFSNKKCYLCSYIYGYSTLQRTLSQKTFQILELQSKTIDLFQQMVTAESASNGKHSYTSF
jgi:hypothetical protein